MIHSMAGQLEAGRILRRRPFRDPHHSASLVAPTGGGPGEGSSGDGSRRFRLIRDCSTQRQTGEIDLRGAGGDQVGDDAGGAAGHGPAHMAMAAVVEQIAVPAAAEEGGALRCHGPQAGPIGGTFVVSAPGEQLLGGGQHEVEIGRLVAGVVAGEFGNPG